MAFKFFRRRQKMVIVIMALLMISFLVGVQGFQMLTRKNPRKREVGTTLFGSLRAGEIWTGTTDIELLSRNVRLGSPQRMIQQLWPTDLEFLTIESRNERPGVAYALLLQEARDNGVLVTEADIDSFFEQVGRPVDSDAYRAMISDLKAGSQMAAKHLRSAVARWLTINKAYMAAAAINVPPSEAELRRLYRDLNEQIDLHVASIPAERFVDEIPQPAQADVQTQFDDFKNLPAGNYCFTTDDGLGDAAGRIP